MDLGANGSRLQPLNRRARSTNGRILSIASVTSCMNGRNRMRWEFVNLRGARSLGNVEIASVPPRNPVPLNLVVCLKQIPNPDLQFQIAPDGKDFRRDALNYKLNGADEYALEEAVRLKEKNGGRVVAVTLGPKRTEQMLREALAKGADEAVRIAWDDPAAFDAGKNARLLAAAVRTLPHDLVLTGVQSDDYVNSATGGLLAGILGLAHASGVTRVAVQGSLAEGACRPARWLQPGYTPPVPAPPPIPFGADPPRYAPLPAIMKAARPPI